MVERCKNTQRFEGKRMFVKCIHCAYVVKCFPCMHPVNIYWRAFASFVCFIFFTFWLFGLKPRLEYMQRILFWYRPLSIVDPYVWNIMQVNVKQVLPFWTQIKYHSHAQSSSLFLCLGRVCYSIRLCKYANLYRPFWFRINIHKQWADNSFLCIYCMQFFIQIEKY